MTSTRCARRCRRSFPPPSRRCWCAPTPGATCAAPSVAGPWPCRQRPNGRARCGSARTPAVTGSPPPPCCCRTGRPGRGSAPSWPSPPWTPRPADSCRRSCSDRCTTAAAAPSPHRPRPRSPSSASRSARSTSPRCRPWPTPTTARRSAFGPRSPTATAGPGTCSRPAPRRPAFAPTPAARRPCRPGSGTARSPDRAPVRPAVPAADRRPPILGLRPVVRLSGRRR